MNPRIALAVAALFVSTSGAEEVSDTSQPATPPRGDAGTTKISDEYPLRELKQAKEEKTASKAPAQVETDAPNAPVNGKVWEVGDVQSTCGVLQFNSPAEDEGLSLHLGFGSWNTTDAETFVDAPVVVTTGVKVQQRFCFARGMQLQAPTVLRLDSGDDEPLAELVVQLDCPEATAAAGKFKASLAANEKLAQQRSQAAAKQSSRADIKAAATHLHEMSRYRELADQDVAKAAEELLADSMVGDHLRWLAAFVVSSQVQENFRQLELSPTAFLVVPLVASKTRQDDFARAAAAAELRKNSGPSHGILDWAKLGDASAAASHLRRHCGDMFVLAEQSVGPTSEAAGLKSQVKADASALLSGAVKPAKRVKAEVKLGPPQAAYDVDSLHSRRAVWLGLIGTVLAPSFLLVVLQQGAWPIQGQSAVCVPFFMMLQMLCLLGPWTAYQKGGVDCAVGFPWELHFFFTVLAAAVGVGFNATKSEHDLQEVADDKVCGYFTLPYCGSKTLARVGLFCFHLLERFDFYGDVCFVFLALACGWKWAVASGCLLIFSTFAQALALALGQEQGRERIINFAVVLLGMGPSQFECMSFGAGPAVTHPKAKLLHALARVLTEDGPQIGLQLLFSREVRRDPFVLLSAGVSLGFALKELSKIVQELCSKNRQYTLLSS